MGYLIASLIRLIATLISLIASLIRSSRMVYRAGVTLRLENGLWAPGQPIFLSRGKVGAIDDL